MSASLPLSHTSLSGESPTSNPDPWLFTGIILTPIRLVTGFLFFSAFWRRFIDAPHKMDPDAMGYVGEKFNHFMPHAIFGQKQLIEYLLAHPSLLHLFLIVFTILEGLCGLGLITGTLTRISALGITLMSWGVLTGSGWIGTTCLDEWQIGVLGMSGGLLVMTGGAGPWAMDHWAGRKWPALGAKKWFRVVASGPLFPVQKLNWKIAYAAAALVMLGITMVTYQAFFNGLSGDLHNHSVRPDIELTNATLTPAGDAVSFNIYRTDGPDTYGAFLIHAAVMNEAGETVVEWKAEDMASVAPADIENHYLVKVRPHENSLLAPLGGSARINLRSPSLAVLPGGKYMLHLEDVSGAKWKTDLSF